MSASSLVLAFHGILHVLGLSAYPGGRDARQAFALPSAHEAQARLASLVISDIRSMSRACDAVSGINLGQGICDLPTPAPVAQAARDAITENRVVYTAPEGIAPLRDAVRQKIARHYGLDFDPASEIVVTSGATGGFAAACLALFDPGDEILLLEPYYGYHLNTLLTFGLKPVLVPTRPPEWSIDFEALVQAITPRTRAVVVCTPANPSGKVWTTEELDKLAAILEAHDLIAVTDEIYEHIVFDGQKHVPLATRATPASARSRSLASPRRSPSPAGASATSPRLPSSRAGSPWRTISSTSAPRRRSSMESWPAWGCPTRTMPISRGATP